MAGEIDLPPTTSAKRFPSPIRRTKTGVVIISSSPASSSEESAAPPPPKRPKFKRESSFGQTFSSIRCLTICSEPKEPRDQWLEDEGRGLHRASGQGEGPSSECAGL